MDIQTIPVGKINPAPYNPRLDLQPGDPDYEKLKHSMIEFGFVEPLVWNKRTGNLVGGHQRFKVLVDEMKTDKVQVSVVDLDDAHEKALNLALNKIEGDWDRDALKDLLQELDTGEIDLYLTGFDEEEIERMMTEVHKEVDGDETDLSDKVSDKFEVIVTCENELEQEQLYYRLTEEGLKCRVSTL
ncbi:ParB N-terminal domain-containing protein [Alicyclobacillus sp. ALC3]|uniref:ParB N-terminal domain-containing protein n=1 Tax=Alicyclobacillus sp. ALC3 TaxID=2796143 RepID=UPI00237906D8|nr:ParB N-terminal domain-containing protein [Alicyclobacillus sp. ALC3]WDL98141.1 ParB N-terminal domain-containing protein [Alicyclobacillus sp. ALC3]